MSAKIYDALVSHSLKNRSSFHTPGHKSNNRLMPVEIFDIDLTELPDTDNLFSPCGAIEHSEKVAADFFCSDRTLFSSFGCSLCIQTMIRLATTTGGKIIADRNIHQSAVNAMALLDVEPVWLYADNSAGEFFPGRIIVENLEKLLKENRNIQAVYITNPNYYGILSDIGKIATIVHSYNIPLLIDNAHGSHLYLTNKKERDALLCADMVCCSLHKTLPVMTGGAVLNINNPKFSKYAKKAMKLFASTSPSFPILASIDRCIEYLKNNANEVKSRFEYIKSEVANINTIAHKKDFIIPKGYNDDTRISLCCSNFEYNADYIADKMRKCAIEPEFSDGINIVFIPTIFNTKEDFERLKSFISGFNIKVKSLKIDNEKLKYEVVANKSVMSMRKALLSKTKWIPTERSEGEIASDCICVCPPGFPILLPGERISKQAINLCKLQKINTIAVVEA